MNTERVANHIVNWLKEYAEKANVKGFVLEFLAELTLL